MTTKNDIYSAKTTARAAKEAYYAACRAIHETEAKRYSDLADMIAHLDEPTTSVIISAKTNGDFSHQSIEQLARYADYRRKRIDMGKNYWGCVSCPSLRRKVYHGIRHYAELDNDGNVIPGTIRDKDVEYYKYYVD